MKYTVYCDESCHLQKDHSPVMVLGAMYCPTEKKEIIFDDIRNIKKQFGLSSFFEIKWTKVSESKIDFYIKLMDYFWQNDDLHYRGLVAKGKDHLNHEKYNDGDYNLWYYKMYFQMLDPIICPENEYSILVDIKDSKGGKRIRELREVLCNNIYDFKREVIRNIVQINSTESEILQLADLFNGALAFHYRGLDQNIESNQGKVSFVKQLQSKQDIDIMTPKQASKFNLFVWKPRLIGEQNG